jgi:hypothetical protein
MTAKYNKLPYNIQKGSKIDQMALKLPTSFTARHSKIFPNWNFWFQNIPSGNPGGMTRHHSSSSVWPEFCSVKTTKKLGAKISNMEPIRLTG